MSQRSAIHNRSMKFELPYSVGQAANVLSAFLRTESKTARSGEHFGPFHTRVVLMMQFPRGGKALRMDLPLRKQYVDGKLSVDREIADWFEISKLGFSEALRPVLIVSMP